MSAKDLSILAAREDDVAGIFRFSLHYFIFRFSISIIIFSFSFSIVFFVSFDLLHARRMPLKRQYAFLAADGSVIFITGHS